jgi:hypothetical protein
MDTTELHDPTLIQPPSLIFGRFDIENMTPKERVFGILRGLIFRIANAEDLNSERERLVIALDRCISWESELIDK